MIWSAVSNWAGFERWLISPVWIMKDGFAGRGIHLGDRLRQRAVGVRVGGLVEADVAVAELEEAEGLRFFCLSLADQAGRAGNAAGERPQNAGAGPGHAFEDLAPRGALFVIVSIMRHVGLLPKLGCFRVMRLAPERLYSCEGARQVVARALQNPIEVIGKRGRHEALTIATRAPSANSTGKVAPFDFLQGGRHESRLVRREGRRANQRSSCARD